MTSRAIYRSLLSSPVTAIQGIVGWIAWLDVAAGIQVIRAAVEVFGDQQELNERAPGPQGTFCDFRVALVFVLTSRSIGRLSALIYAAVRERYAEFRTRKL